MHSEPSSTDGFGVEAGSLSENQVLLAQFNLWAEEVGDDFEAEHATLFYMINRDDLAARRFDAASMEYDFNG